MPRPHPIFDDIGNGDLAAVQRRVRADPAVLDERYDGGETPLMYAIWFGAPAIALWLIEHRGDHNLDTTAWGYKDTTALHDACRCGELAVVKALVAAGANATKTITLTGWTPLMHAAYRNHVHVVAFVLSLLAVLGSIDSLSGNNYSAISLASYHGRLLVVNLLLDAGADPAIPSGPDSPLNIAIRNGHHTVAALLRQAIDHRRVALPLLKARVLLEASQPHAPVPACLQGRVTRNQPLPTLAINGDENDDDQTAAATLRFVLGLEGHGGWAGAEDERATMRAEGLFPEVFVELLEYLLPAAVARAAAGGMQ